MLATILSLALLAGPDAHSPPVEEWAAYAPVPLCRVTVTVRPARWAETPGGLPWRYLDVSTVPDCPSGGEAHVRLSNYGGWRPGAVVIVPSGGTVTFGPVPIYRALDWLSASGIPYRVPLPEESYP